MQAEFNLEGARENLQEAVRVDPENALAWRGCRRCICLLGN